MNGHIKLSAILYCILLFSCRNNPYPQGAHLYYSYCASCHMEDGSGLGALYPPIAKADYLAANLTQLPCIIQNGLYDSIEVNGIIYNQAMLAVNELNQTEMLNLVNYIRHNWYRKQGAISPIELENQLAECE